MSSDEFFDTKPPRMGHNNGVDADALRSLIERIEKLEADKADIAADIRDVFAEAKAHGYDVKTMREILKLRKVDEAKREEQEAVLDVYMMALGMIPAFERE